LIVCVGGYFLAQDGLPCSSDLNTCALPIRLIAAGILILFKSAASRGGQHRHDRPRQHIPANPYAHVAHGEEDISPASSEEPAESARQNSRAMGEDMIDMTAIFGGIKKRVFSKNSRGGDITTLLGGAEIDFTQADINGRAHVDMTLFCGGATLIVPANWSVESDLVAIFGGINVKRSHGVESGENNKVLVISGTAI